jgi:hypothetical protein
MRYKCQSLVCTPMATQHIFRARGFGGRTPCHPPICKHDPWISKLSTFRACAKLTRRPSHYSQNINIEMPIYLVNTPRSRLYTIQFPLETMCDYTQVEFRCGHCRYTVRAWCIVYETTHIRCRPNVVAVEFRYVDSTV